VFEGGSRAERRASPPAPSFVDEPFSVPVLDEEDEGGPLAAVFTLAAAFERVAEFTTPAGAATCPAGGGPRTDAFASWMILDATTYWRSVAFNEN
jgi:hypothetical protein